MKCFSTTAPPSHSTQFSTSFLLRRYPLLFPLNSSIHTHTQHTDRFRQLTSQVLYLYHGILLRSCTCFPSLGAGWPGTPPLEIETGMYCMYVMNIFICLWVSGLIYVYMYIYILTHLYMYMYIHRLPPSSPPRLLPPYIGRPPKACRMP